MQWDRVTALSGAVSTITHGCSPAQFEIGAFVVGVPDENGVTWNLDGSLLLN